MPGQARPVAAASMCRLDALMVSSRMVDVHAHAERCRHPPCEGPRGGCCVTDIRGFLERGDSFTEHGMYISVVLMSVVK